MHEAADRDRERIDSVYGLLARLLGGRPDALALPDNSTHAWNSAFYALADLIDERTRLVGLAQVPTSGGLVNPAARIGEIPRAAGGPLSARRHPVGRAVPRGRRGARLRHEQANRLIEQSMEEWNRVSRARDLRSETGLVRD